MSMVYMHRYKQSLSLTSVYSVSHSLSLFTNSHSPFITPFRHNTILLKAFTLTFPATTNR